MKSFVIYYVGIEANSKTMNPFVSSCNVTYHWKQKTRARKEIFVKSSYAAYWLGIEAKTKTRLLLVKSCYVTCYLEREAKSRPKNLPV